MELQGRNQRIFILPAKAHRLRRVFANVHTPTKTPQKIRFRTQRSQVRLKLILCFINNNIHFIFCRV
jgi:hypothetical protein